MKQHGEVYSPASERIEDDVAIITFVNDIGKSFEVRVDAKDLVMRDIMNNKRIAATRSIKPRWRG